MSSVYTQRFSHVFVGIIVCSGLFLLRTTWHFADDDFGAFWSGKNHTTRDTLDYFAYKTNDLTIMPSNMQNRPMSFFAVTYRPLTLLWYALVAKILQAKTTFNPWWFFIFSILLHGLCVALLCFLLTPFVGPPLAATISLVFGFFPCLGKCLGPLSFQPFSLCLLLVMLLSSATYWAIHRNKQALLPFFGLATLLTLFLHEICFFAPCWLWILALYIFYRRHNNFKQALLYSLGLLISIFCVYAFYLGLRLYLFPPSLQQTQIFAPHQIFSRLKIRFYDFITLLIDIFGLTWLGSGHKFLKTVLLFLTVSWTAWLWLTTTKKAFTALLWLGCLLFIWPSILIMHQARYLYVGLPFFLAGLAVAIKNLPLQQPPARYLKTISFCVFLVWILTGFTYIQAYWRGYCVRQKTVATNIRKLANATKFFDKNIFFVGLPHELFPHGGIAQAIWIMGPESQAHRKIFYDDCLSAHCLPVNIATKPIIRKNLLETIIQPPNIILQSKRPRKIWLKLHSVFGTPTNCSTGKILRARVTTNPEKSAAVKVCVDEKWLNPMPVFISWNYKKQKFVRIKPTLNFPST